MLIDVFGAIFYLRPSRHDYCETWPAAQISGLLHDHVRLWGFGQTVSKISVAHGYAADPPKIMVLLRGV